MRATAILTTTALAVLSFAGLGSGGDIQKPTQVKVAAVQVLGYDKTDVPRPGFDPSEAVIPYIEKAAKDGTQLVVFPEYLLGRISVPGPQTERISKAAAAGRIYVRHDQFGAGSKGQEEQSKSPAATAGALRRDREAVWHVRPTEQMMFAKYIGVDYSGRGTRLSRLPGLQVYAIAGDRFPERINPPSVPKGKHRNWCRKEVAKWLLQQIEAGQPFIAGVTTIPA